MTSVINQFEKEFKDLHNLRPFQTFLGLTVSYGVIAGAYWVTTRLSFWLYPLAAFLIGNRQYALALLGHEAVHGCLFKHPQLNRLIGQFLCHYPVFVLHQRYKVQHLLHHRFLGTAMDPDLAFYDQFPLKKKDYLNSIVTLFLSGRLLVSFLEYYSGLRWPSGTHRNYQIKGPSDAKLFFSFWTLIILMMLYWQTLDTFILFWFLPLFFWLPWVQFKTPLEHAPLKTDQSPLGKTRTILAPLWLRCLFFPNHINFHAEHHLLPSVPHYNLPAVSERLRSPDAVKSDENLQLHYCDFKTACKEIFTS